MYVPEHYALTDPTAIRDLVARYPFAALVTHGADGFFATHLPTAVSWSNGDDVKGTIACHFARANPHWKLLANGARALVIYNGPQAYVTPSWYPTKLETGKVVPTWNYAVVHVTGTAKVIDDPDWLLAHVSQLSDQEEAYRDAPWATADAPNTYIGAMLRGIVGVEIEIEAVEAKAKMNQNKTDVERHAVVDGLAQRGRDSDEATRAWVSRCLSGRT